MAQWQIQLYSVNSYQIPYFPATCLQLDHCSQHMFSRKLAWLFFWALPCGISESEAMDGNASRICRIAMNSIMMHYASESIESSEPNEQYEHLAIERSASRLRYGQCANQADGCWNIVLPWSGTRKTKEDQGSEKLLKDAKRPWNLISVFETWYFLTQGGIAVGLDNRHWHIQ